MLGDEDCSPFGDCEGGSDEFEYRVWPDGGGFSGAKSAVDACQAREHPPPTAKSVEAMAMAALTRMTTPSGPIPRMRVDIQRCHFRSD